MQRKHKINVKMRFYISHDKMKQFISKTAHYRLKWLHYYIHHNLTCGHNAQPKVLTIYEKVLNLAG